MAEYPLALKSDVASVSSRFTYTTPEEYGAEANGVVDSTQPLRDAIAALPSGGVISLRPGTYLLTGKVDVPANIRIEGAGSEATYISHTSDGIGLNFERPAGGDLFTPRGISGVRINGNSGASAIGIRLSDFYRGAFRDLFIQGYTGGCAVELNNLLSWTEGIIFEHVHIRNCLTGWRLVGDVDPKRSFAELSFHHCACVLDVANSIGVDVGDHCNAYGGIWNIKFNVEVSSATCIRLGATNAWVRQNLYHLYAESTGGGTGVQVLTGGSGSQFTGTGEFFIDLTMSHDRDAADAFRFGPEIGSVAIVGPNAELSAHAAKKTQGVDGEVLILNNSGLYRVTAIFNGPDRVHRMTFYASANAFDTEPAVSVVEDYAYNDARVFSEPFYRFESGTLAEPHLFLEVTNRNTGDDLRVIVESFTNAELKLFPTSTLATPTGRAFGTKLMVDADGEGFFVGSGRDTRIYRRTASTVTVDNGAGGAANLELLGNSLKMGALSDSSIRWIAAGQLETDHMDFNSIRVGGGPALVGLLGLNVLHDFGIVGAEGVQTADFTITGARPGDACLISWGTGGPPSHLVQPTAFVPANDTVRVIMTNHSPSSSYDPGAQTFTILVLRRES